MKPAVILYTVLPDGLYQRLSAIFNVVIVRDLNKASIQQQSSSFTAAIGLIGAEGFIKETQMKNRPALRFCSIISAGYDRIDVSALTRHKLLLTHTPNALTETEADLMMALVLASAQNILAINDEVKTGNGEKDQQSPPLTQDVHHKKNGDNWYGPDRTRLSSSIAPRFLNGDYLS